MHSFYKKIFSANFLVFSIKASLTLPSVIETNHLMLRHVDYSQIPPNYRFYRASRDSLEILLFLLPLDK